MMKHVQLSPYRSRADTVSLSSNASFASLSPEPLTSRSSSYSSLNDTSSNSPIGSGQHYPPKTTIKVYARCLRPDIEYKTLCITYQTSCREVVDTLLSKYRMKHRDPRLFYLSMEVTVRKAGVRTHIALDDEAKPAVLQSCHPRGDSRFSLQTRRGGLVKVYDSALNSNSQYKSLLISARTTSDELIALLLACYTSTIGGTGGGNSQLVQSSSPAALRVEQFSLYEVCPAREQQRKLHPDDRPLLVQQTWSSANSCHFLIRRNPDYRPLTRRKFPSIMWRSNEITKDAIHHYPKTPTRTPPEEKDRVLEEKKHQNKYSNNSHVMQKQQQHVVRREYNNNNTSTTNNNNNDCESSPRTIRNVPVGPTSYADYENYFYI